MEPTPHQPHTPKKTWIIAGLIVLALIAALVIQYFIRTYRTPVVYTSLTSPTQGYGTRVPDQSYVLVGRKAATTEVSALVSPTEFIVAPDVDQTKVEQTMLPLANGSTAYGASAEPGVIVVDQFQPTLLHGEVGETAALTVGAISPNNRVYVSTAAGFITAIVYDTTARTVTATIWGDAHVWNVRMYAEDTKDLEQVVTILNDWREI